MLVVGQERQKNMLRNNMHHYVLVSCILYPFLSRYSYIECCCVEFWCEFTQCLIEYDFLNLETYASHYTMYMDN